MTLPAGASCEDQRPLIYLVGDSIRGSYQEILQALFGGSAKVAGPKDNAFDSKNIRTKLETWLEGKSPVIGTLNCGLHDVVRPKDTGRLRVEIEDYAKNLDEILTQMRQCCSGPVFWITTTPVLEERHNSRRPFERWNADIGAYNAAAATVAARHACPVIDLGAFVERSAMPDWIADGVHFSPAGRLALAGEVFRHLRPALDKHLGLEGEDSVLHDVKASISFLTE